MERESECGEREREREILVSTPPPRNWESKSKSCCISVLLCCDVAQAEPDAEQTSTQNPDQPSPLRTGDPLPAASLASTTCPLQ